MCFLTAFGSSSRCDTLKKLRKTGDAREHAGPGLQQSPCAKEESCRNNVEQLEVVRYPAKHTFEVGLYRAGKLINQESSVGAENGMSLSHDSISQRVGQRLEWNTGYDVIRLAITKTGQHFIDPSGGFLDQLKTWIFERGPQVSRKVRVDFQRDEARIPSHPLEQSAGKGACSRSVFNDDPRRFPIYLLEHLLEQERGTGQHPTHHARVF